jgi:hypothetical protein
VSGILTFALGVAIGLVGFFTFATDMATSNNTWMLSQLGRPNADLSVALVPYGMSVLTLFIFLFFTPTGWLAMYVAASGAFRGFSAWFDDPRGDPILSVVDWAALTLFRQIRLERRQLARERREGPDAPDVLRPGAWAGLAGVDYVVLAARRKAEWNAGAIVMTGDDWYKLGVPFDLDTPAGLRTVYPLTKMETVEVVRRGIQYELPKVKGGRQA